MRSWAAALTASTLFFVACSEEKTPDASVDRDGGSVVDASPDRDAGERRDAGAARDAGETNDGGDDGDGGAPLGCLELTTDLDTTFVLQPSVEASIELTMNSTTPPSAMAERGLFSLTSERWGGNTFERVRSSDGPIRSSRDVIVGQHLARFSGGSCSPPDMTPFCASAVVSAPLRAGDNTVDFPYGTFEMTFTVDGAPFPAAVPGAMSRGSLSLASAGASAFFTRRFDLPAAGPARIATGGFLDTYDIVFDANALCPAVFCGGGSLGPLLISGLGQTQTIDIDTVVVAGTITQDGALVPPSPLGPGVLSFHDLTRLRSFGSVQLAADGSYSLRLVAGRYAVAFSGFDSGPMTPTPVSSLFVELDRNFVGDTTMNFDLSTVTADLGLTANGAPLANDLNGYLVLAKDDEQSMFIPLENLRAGGRWARLVIAEEYTARFIPADPCVVSDGVPCLTYDLPNPVDLRSSATRTLDLTSHLVEITLTARGASLFDTTDTRGRVFLSLENGPVGGQLELDVPATGPATVTTRLPSGRYRLYYSTPAGDGCTNGDLGPVPCGGNELPAIEVAGDLSATIDIPSVTVSGVVRIGGAPLLVPTGDAPTLTFENFGVALFSTPIDERGAFSTLVPPASYRVSFSPGTLCEGRDVPAPRPCAPQIIHMCGED